MIYILHLKHILMYNKSMHRLRIEAYFLICLTIVVTILFFKGTMYKTQYYGLDRNLTFEAFFWVLPISLFGFYLFVLKYGIIRSILMTFLISFVSIIFTHTCFRHFMNLIEKLDHQRTPLGWQFKYKWLQLELMGIFMVLGTELSLTMAKVLKSKNK